jgi:hypothetical protein
MEACMNTTTFSTPVILHTYPSMKMEQIDCSEMLAYKIQTLVNYPEESIQHSEHGKSLKSRLRLLGMTFHENTSLGVSKVLCYMIRTEHEMMSCGRAVMKTVVNVVMKVMAVNN